MTPRPARPASVVSVGVDLVEVGRVERLWQRRGNAFLRRVFTTGELEWCLNRARPPESLAVRFAAKEAVMKCLRTGWTAGVAFHQIEIGRDPSGAPTVALSGKAAQTAEALGIHKVHISLSHTNNQATAFAVAVG